MEAMIYTRLAEVMKQIGAVGKTEFNKAQGFKFRGIDQVMNELHAIFAQNEIFVTTNVLEYKADVTPVETEYQGSKKFTIWTTTRAHVEFTFYTTDGSFVKAMVVGEGRDSADKSMNKALSAAYKYALLQMFLIPTEDRKDADYDSPETTVEKKKAVGMVLDNAIKRANSTKSITELVGLWNEYEILHDNNTFKNCLNVNKKRFQQDE